ncbi:hypothetical protein [Sinorhizobium alkalisoli]|uniref:Uncharacterized protein n=1 Tax=Sinorhizobium alkalisoli TaxID=1752398 RepID=A0A1E3VHQ2_9HYPH|nr:hypothetical protein [Sinorhizobium alkalisoli]MCG5478672.1 hypothetical protein [Sinorhizobium alkalisoli]ODR93098.1 hypothetical protein A8M32_01515 [Sinorhizobium alkalisoli]QFI70552.1 hypothetical protein EKH55_5678 [Sinorhizobium alkalisoli]
MGDTPQEAIVIGMTSVSIAAFALAGLRRALSLDAAWTGLIVSAAFLASYFLVYQKIPPIPAVGAVNKIFYISLAGAVAGFAADLANRPRLAGWLSLVQPLAAALYIAQSRLTVAPLEIAVAVAAGMLSMTLLQRDFGGSAAEDGMKRMLLLAIATLGFAPIALLGASSSSLQVCLIFAVALLAIVVWSFGSDDNPFGTPALLGGAGGMLSVVYAVTLITRKADLLALATLGLVFLVPELARRIKWIGRLRRRFARLFAFGLLCAIPAAAAAAIAILSYGSSFPI